MKRSHVWAFAAAAVLVGCAASGTGGSFDPGDGGSSSDARADQSAPGECVAVDVSGSAGALPYDGGTSTAACRPASVSSFSPTYKPPTGARQGKCTAAMISSFYDLCLDEAAPEGQCASQFGTAAAAANKDCAQCLVTAETAGQHGPLIDRTDTVSVNVAGCIAHLEPCNEACAKAMQAEDDCGIAACKTNCPVTNATSLAAFSRCQAEAAGNGCKSYAAKARCVEAISGSEHPASVCTAGTSFRALYEAVAPVFCGQ